MADTEVSVNPRPKTVTGQHDAQQQILPTGGAPLGGWHTIAKTVRDVDEEKVKDCREDIDTLLVFVSRCLYHML